MYDYFMYYGSDTFSFLIFWMMVLEVTMTQFKNDNLQKPNIALVKCEYGKQTESQKKRK